jgi:hypothetical protein
LLRNACVADAMGAIAAEFERDELRYCEHAVEPTADVGENDVANRRETEELGAAFDEHASVEHDPLDEPATKSTTRAISLSPFDHSRLWPRSCARACSSRASAAESLPVRRACVS